MNALTTLLLCLLCLPVFGQATEELPRTAEHMPLFRSADCPADESYPSRKACADRALLEAIYSQLNYPDEARSYGGPDKLAVVNLVVAEDGSVSDVEVYRDPGYGMGAEAQRVVEQLAATRGFEPATNEGTPVRMLLQLPIKFTRPENNPSGP